MAISFTPTFRHVPWADRLDRATASGPNGFNVRFNAIASDLRQFSKTVTDIGAAIDASDNPSPGQQRLSFVPSIPPTPPQNTDWFYDPGGVADGLNISDGNFFGVANLSLPDGVNLVSMRVLGDIDGGGSNFGGSIVLSRTPLRLVIPPSSPETLANIQFTESEEPFDRLEPTVASRALIDTSLFRYFLTMQIVGVQLTLGLHAIELTFTPPT